MGYKPMVFAQNRTISDSYKFTQTIPQAVRISFASMQEAFQGVWSDFRHLAKSAMFKTMGYSPGSLLKIGQLRTLGNSPEIHTRRHNFLAMGLTIWRGVYRVNTESRFINTVIYQEYLSRRTELGNRKNWGQSQVQVNRWDYLGAINK